MISWNLPNWITVLIMAAVGWAVVGAGVAMYRKSTNQGGTG